MDFTAWKVSKYGVFSGPYFPALGPENNPYLDTFHAVHFPWKVTNSEIIIPETETILRYHENKYT